MLKVKEEAKNGFKKFWRVLVLLYIVFIHMIALNSFMHYTQDKDSIIITFDLLDYHKTILLMNE